MTRVSTLLTVAALTAMATTPAHAGIFDKTPTDGNGFYVSGFIGVAAPFDAKFEGTQNPGTGVPGAAGAPASIDAEFDSDVYFGGAFGGRLPYKFLNTFQPRIEVEISHYEASVDSGDFNGGNQTFSGDQSQTFFLINSYNDIRWTENQVFVPYVGGGLGIGIVESDIGYFPNNGNFTAPNFAVRGEDTAFTTVSTIGATWNTSKKFDIYAEARYFKTYGVDAERRFIAGENNGFSANVDDNTDGLTFAIGTRAKF